MGRYRLNEYRCILLKVSRYSDASLLNSIISLHILYDYQVTESDKIISLSMEPNYCHTVQGFFSYKNRHFKTSVHYRKHFIDQCTTIYQYIDALILDLQ